MEPIKWDNRGCQKDYDFGRRCPEYSCETPVSTHGEIISLLESGWPICPECGDDMTPIDEK